MSSFLGALPSFTSLEENVSSSVSNIESQTIEELSRILEFENQVHIQPIIENIAYSDQLIAQAYSLLKSGNITEEDHRQILLEAVRYRKLGERTIKELNELYPTLKQTLKNVIGSIGKGIKTVPRLGVENAIKAAQSARNSAKNSIKLANDRLEEAKAAATSAELLIKQKVGKVTAGLEEVRVLTESGAPVSEITAAADRLARDQAEYKASLSRTNAFAHEVEEATFSAENVVFRATKHVVKADLALEAAKVYSAGGTISSGGVRLIARAIGAYTDPMKKMAFRLQRVGKLVTGGYESFAKTLIEAGDADLFIEEMNNLAGDKAARETQAMRDQMKTVKRLMQQENVVTEDVMAECSKWMSPKWRMTASLNEDFAFFAESLNISKFTDYFVVLGRGAFVLIQSIIKLPLLAAASGLEAVAGRYIATVVVDVTEAIGVGVSEIASAALAPEVLAVMYAFYGFIDAFRVHNFWEWVNDMISAVITPALTDKLYSFRMLQYPFKSRKGDKDWHDDPASMLKIDSEQFKTTIDFWGSAFINEINKVKKTNLRYKQFEPYEGIMRVPGRYIDPRDHPYDTQEEIDVCLETEKYFDDNLLVDATGKLNGEGSYLPQEPGLVRNIVSFPIYQYGITWPDIKGSLVQTKGRFVEESADEYIVGLWKYWIESGEWGPAFTHPSSTPQTRQAAIASNKSDFADFMSPRRDSPFAWTNVLEWVNNNKGKKSLLEQVMGGEEYQNEHKERVDFHLSNGAGVTAATKASEDMLWKLYIASTRHTRTIWGYISKIRTLLLVETQQNVNVMVGVRKAAVWERWLSTVSKTGIPMNTNRYHRLEFVGKLNQLVYADNLERRLQIETELSKTGGAILENRLITTGSVSSVITKAWAKAIERRSITAILSEIDFPVFFGDLHCRIIVVQKPKLTCFIVFRGTTNAWEWVVDLDFVSAEFGHIKDGSMPGTYELEVRTAQSGFSLTDLLYDAPDTFSVHRGFLRAWQAFKPEVTRQLLDIYGKYSIEDVIVTGHSLGAGITQIACLELPSVPVGRKHTLHGHSAPINYRRPHAYMYASPAVGDSRFAWHFVNQTSESAHVYIDGDIVTMIPPLLLPSKDTWGADVRNSYLNDIVRLTEAGTGPGKTAWYLASKMFKGMNIPYTPDAWKTGGTWDWTKIAAGITSINIAAKKHKAFHGGGVFIRLDSDRSGVFIEKSSDPGSSEGVMHTMAIGAADMSVLTTRHSIDSIVRALSDISIQNPDLFRDIDKSNSVSWENAVGTSTPLVNPIPLKVERLIEHSTLVAVGRTNKRYAPFQIVPLEDIVPDSVVSVKGLKQEIDKRNRRLKKRKRNDESYYGSL